MDNTTPPGAPFPDERLRATQAVRALARLSRVVERAGGELNLAHYRVLSAVAAGDERASRLAARLALGRPAVSSAVDALCRRGLLLRAEAAEDQRAVALSLTPAGQELLDQVEAEMSGRIAALCALTPDAAQVLESLVWLGDALDQSYPQRLERARAARRKQAR